MRLGVGNGRGLFHLKSDVRPLSRDSRKVHLLLRCAPRLLLRRYLYYRGERWGLSKVHNREQDEDRRVQSTYKSWHNDFQARGVSDPHGRGRTEHVRYSVAGSW